MFKGPTRILDAADIVVDGMAQEEVGRRRWCIEEATSMCETCPGDVIETAQKIYNFVWGAKQ